MITSELLLILILVGVNTALLEYLSLKITVPTVIIVHRLKSNLLYRKKMKLLYCSISSLLLQILQKKLLSKMADFRLYRK